MDRNEPATGADAFEYEPRFWSLYGANALGRLWMSIRDSETERPARLGELRLFGVPLMCSPDD